MTKNEIKKLCENINSNFKPPFLPKGAVRALPYKNGKGFTLTIGPRDVDFSNELEVEAAGTCMM